MAIDFPITLPVPQTMQVTPMERAQFSDADRPREARALSLDRLAIVRAVWPALPPAKAEIFRAWWRDTVYQGGAWFNATWPLPQGRVPSVFRFIEQPTWRFVPGGYWRIEAVLEQRGRTLSVIDGALGITPTGWDPDLTTGAVVLSESNFVAEAFSPTGGVVSLRSHTDTGNFYAEVVILAPGSGYLANDPASVDHYHVAPADVWAGGESMSLLLDGTVITPDAGPVGSVSALAPGDVVMIAIQIDTGKGYFGVNGSWILGCDPDTGTALGLFTAPTLDNYYVSYGVGSSEIDAKGRIRTGTGQFSYAAPTNHAQWAA